MSAVLIRGQGVAAACCARLLESAGVSVALESNARPTIPAIMLGENTQKLISDIVPAADLFGGLPRVHKRVVAWGTNETAVTLPHEAVVLSEAELLARIHPGIADPALENEAPPKWTIFASRPVPAPSLEHCFGSRLANVAATKWKHHADKETCCVESVRSGWLFLLPAGEDGGWLLSVGAPAGSLLSESHLVPSLISDMREMGSGFPAHPRIMEPLCLSGWLACGSAAVNFDPLCGDGAGNSAREAILAAALIRAVHDGGDERALLAHYETRILLAFKKHLEVCRDFYRAGRAGPWWDDQVDAAARGVAWCDAALRDRPAFRYRLRNFSLEPVD